jgi:hypothetical protein
LLGNKIVPTTKRYDVFISQTIMEVIITALNFGGSITPKLNDKLKYSKKASFGIMLINDAIKTIIIEK